MRDISLSFRLICILSLLLILLLSVSILLIYYGARARIDKDYDAQLISEAHLLWMIASEENEEPKGLEQIDLDFGAPSMSPQQRLILTQYTKWRAFRIWKNGQLAEQSDTSKILSPKPSEAGFSEYTQNGARWRAYTIYIPKGNMVIEAWENLDNRDRLLYGIIDEVINPTIILFPIFSILFVLSLRYGLKDLRSMAKQLSSRKPEDLSRLDTKNLPKELQPLQNSLNSLLDKLQNTLDREQQFIENSAHELKTPLAVLKLQSQLIGEAPSEKERMECIRSLQEGVDRTRTLFDQILTLSRISSDRINITPFSLTEILNPIIIERSALADQKNIDLIMKGNNFEIISNPGLFGLMVGILIDNSLKYTDDGRVIISLNKDYLEISDTGIGIPDHEKERVFDRFYRVKGNKTLGSGLGLAIAKKCADILNLSISLHTPAQHSGLTARVHFNLSEKY